MITIRKAAIRSYRSIVKADIQFGHITVMIGPSDSGKSNLVRALRDWAHFAVGTDMLTQGHGVCRVAVALERYKIVLEKSDGRNKKSYQGHARYVVKDGETGKVLSYEKLGRSVPQEVVDLTGIRPVVIGDKRDRDPLKLQIQFSEQDDPAFLINTKVWPPSATSKVIGKISGVDALILANRDLGLRRKQNTRESTRLAEEVLEIQGRLTQYEHVDEALAVLEQAKVAVDQIGEDEATLTQTRDLAQWIATRTKARKAAERLITHHQKVIDQVEATGLFKDYDTLADATDLVVLIGRRQAMLDDAENSVEGRQICLKGLARELREAAQDEDLQCPLCGQAAHEECRECLIEEAGR